MIILEHLHVWIVGQTIFAYRWEIRGFPTASIQILFDLGRHARSLYFLQRSEMVGQAVCILLKTLMSSIQPEHETVLSNVV